MFFIIAKIISLFIWNISFEGNYSYTDVEMIDFLKSNGIKNGLSKSKIDCDNIEYLIRTKYDEITWVSAEIKGTKLIIHIKENYDGYICKEETKPYNIISDVNGTVTSIITRAGKPYVKIGDEITQGQLLVGGILEIIGDDKTVISTKEVNSDADIYANTKIDYYDQFTMQYVQKQYTGKQNRILCFNIFAKDIYLSGFQKKFKNSDIFTDYEQFSVTNNFYLPFGYSKIKIKEYKNINKVYTSDEANYLASEKLNIFIQKLQEKGIQILENNVTISVDEQYCTSSGYLFVNQKVGDIQFLDEIPTEETETQTGE